jgi:hypothetical protein
MREKDGRCNEQRQAVEGQVGLLSLLERAKSMQCKLHCRLVCLAASAGAALSVERGASFA